MYALTELGNIASLIPIKLKKENFALSRSLFLPVLRSLDLDSFIDGSSTPPKFVHELVDDTPVVIRLGSTAYPVESTHGDLSFNKLSSKIPGELGHLEIINTLDLSYNNLSGLIPRTKNFARFPAESFFGNPLLCGEWNGSLCEKHGHESKGHLTAKSDVLYSFGVVLLEMLLSSRRAVDKNRPYGEHNLVEWAKPYLNNKHKLFRVLDSRLEGQYSLGGAQKAANLALQCLSTKVKFRPNMDEVFSALEQLQESKGQ